MSSDLAIFTVTLLFICIIPASAADGPEYGGRYTKQRIANLRANVEKFDWAQNQRTSAVNSAAHWLNISDEDLWAMIPCQDLPRNIDPQIDHGVRTGGCPVCGSDPYRDSNKYPWKVDVWNHPWKVICPDCGATIPGNDFGAYYKSGIDETGCFNPEKADKNILFNTDHPDPADPLHKSFVDDGWGFKTDDGAVNRFIGYYAYRYWLVIKSGVAALANAYLYTGDPVYARKAGIMLDRIADVYPDMDWSVYGKQGWFHSGSTDGGKIEGSIWEVGTVITLANAYEQIKPGLYNQPELYRFLADKAKQYTLPTPKDSYSDLVSNIDTNLLGEFVKAVKSGRAIYGNEGDPQHCVIRSAVALNRMPLSAEWIDWTFKEGSIGQGRLKPGEGDHIPGLIVATIDRDGAGAEGSPGYSFSWGVALGAAADLLADYEDYTAHDIYRDFPMFKKTLTVGWRAAVLAATTPNIGDTSSCGGRPFIAADPDFIAKGYRYLKDPEVGKMAVWASHGNVAGLGRDILAADPDWVEKDLLKLAEEYGAEPPIQGDNLHGWGIASIEFGPRDKGQALWMYYGLNSVAGHNSELMCGYDAYGVRLVPPLGYRELWGAWPKSTQWECRTISINTVTVDQVPQNTVRAGQPEFWAQLPGFGGFAVDAREVYPSTDVYRRTMALMQVDENSSYALDIFHILGGSDHVMGFHALPGSVAVTGLNTVPQDGGSYDGPDVSYGTSKDGARMGYSFFKNVARDANPPAAFTLDYAGTPPFPNLTENQNLHVRYHSFTRYDDVALADGIPPGAKPASIRYILGHRAGSDLATTCASIIEPYENIPLIKTAQRLECFDEAGNSVASDGTNGLEPVAVKITLANGAVDYILAGPDDESTYSTADGITFSGRLIALRTRGGQVEDAWMIRASFVEIGHFTLDTPAYYNGTVNKMDKDMTGHGCIWTDAELPTDGRLNGAEIIIENDRKRNACYTIEAVEKDGDLWRIDCGEVAFIRGFVDVYDYSKGYEYNFNEGADWVIPNSISLSRHATGPSNTHSTALP